MVLCRIILLSSLLLLLLLCYHSRCTPVTKSSSSSCKKECILFLHCNNYYDSDTTNMLPTTAITTTNIRMVDAFVPIFYKIPTIISRTPIIRCKGSTIVISSILQNPISRRIRLSSPSILSSLITSKATTTTTSLFVGDIIPLQQQIYEIQQLQQQGSITINNNNMLPFNIPLSSSSSLIFIQQLLCNVMVILITYVSLLLYYDRPKGTLYNTITNTNTTIDSTMNNTNTTILSSALLQVRPSTNIPNGGYGVFCNSIMGIPKNTILGTYPGVHIPLTTTSNNLPNSKKLRLYPHCQIYIWRFSNNQYIIDPTNIYGNIEDYCYGGNPNTFGSIYFYTNIVPTILSILSIHEFNNIKKSTLLCRINEPPKSYDVNVITVEDLQHYTVTFITERDIQYNEELYIDYGIQYDRSNYRL